MAATEAGHVASRAVDDLYRRHGGEVYRYAYAVLGNHADAEDVTQTTFLNAYRALEQGVHPRKPSNWLLTIASNAIKQRFRQEQARPRQVELDDEIARSAEPDGEGPTIGELLTALSKIPPQQREAIVLREFEGRSYAEIAEIIGVTTSALETLLFRARRSLADELDHQLTCTDAQLAVSKAVDGRLGRKQRRRLRDHLAECPDCARFARLQPRHRTALRGLMLIPIPLSLSIFKGLGGPDTATAATIPFPGSAGAGAGTTTSGVGATGGVGALAGGVTIKAAALVAAATLAGGAAVIGAVELSAVPDATPAAEREGVSVLEGSRRSVASERPAIPSRGERRARTRVTSGVVGGSGHPVRGETEAFAPEAGPQESSQHESPQDDAAPASTEAGPQESAPQEGQPQGAAPPERTPPDGTSPTGSDPEASPPATTEQQPTNQQISPKTTSKKPKHQKQHPSPTQRQAHVPKQKQQPTPAQDKPSHEPRAEQPQPKAEQPQTDSEHGAKPEEAPGASVSAEASAPASDKPHGPKP